MVQYVGIGAVQSSGLVGAVEVDEKMVFGCGFSHAVVEVDNHLIVAVHKVDLEAFHAHFGIVLAHAFHVFVHGGMTGPEHEAHIALGTVFDKFR